MRSIQSAEPLNHQIDCRRHGIEIGDVSMQRVHRSTEFRHNLRRGFEPGRVDVENRNSGAGARERQRAGSTDAGRGTRH